MPTASMLRNMGSTRAWGDDDPGTYDEYVDAYIDGTTYYADVTFGRETFEVVVKQMGRDRLTPKCECNLSLYAPHGFACDHTVIALRYLADNFEKITCPISFKLLQ